MIDKSKFAMPFVVECAKLLERNAGRKEAESVLRLVSNEVGKHIEHGFDHGPSSGEPISDKIVRSLLTITSELGAAFEVTSKE